MVIGLLCAADGCPVAVEVFEGNTADPMTLAAQIDKLKQRFKLQRAVMVGDRGVLTDARIERTLRPAGLDWITALHARAIKAPATDDGPLRLSLFDDRDMAEITSPGYPAERLVVCRKPLLAAERARKCDELLAATEADLARLRSRLQRARNPLRGQRPSARPSTRCPVNAEWPNTSTPRSPTTRSASPETTPALSRELRVGDIEPREVVPHRSCCALAACLLVSDFESIRPDHAMGMGCKWVSGGDRSDRR